MIGKYAHCSCVFYLHIRLTEFLSAPISDRFDPSRLLSSFLCMMLEAVRLHVHFLLLKGLPKDHRAGAPLLLLWRGMHVVRSLLKDTKWCMITSMQRVSQMLQNTFTFTGSVYPCFERFLRVKDLLEKIIQHLPVQQSTTPKVGSTSREGAPRMSYFILLSAKPRLQSHWRRGSF